MRIAERNRDMDKYKVVFSDGTEDLEEQLNLWSEENYRVIQYEVKEIKAAPDASAIYHFVILEKE